MKQRPKLILRKGIALAALVAPVVGCGSDTPQEAFRASLDDACETLAACGMPEPECATAASRDAIVAEILAEAPAAASEACIDVYFELYADYYGCFANLSCEQIAADDPRGL